MKTNEPSLPWNRLNISREDWTELALAFYAVAHGSRTEFDSLPATLRECPVGILCERCLESSGSTLLDETGFALTGSRDWYTFLGRMF